VLNHPEAGVLSALGIGLADVARHRSCGIERQLDKEALSFAREQLAALEREAVNEVRGEGVEDITATRSLDVRYRGVDSFLTLDWPMDDDFATSFAAAHKQRYGYVHKGRPLEILAARVAVVGRVANTLPQSVRHTHGTPTPRRHLTAHFDGARCEVPLFERSELTAGDRIAGPAIVTEDISTTVIEHGWLAEVMSESELLLTDGGKWGVGSGEGANQAAIQDRKQEILVTQCCWRFSTIN
jgi:5-oxoprolinase (ATP-hydrolysing)